MRILAISGSLRRASHNTGLLRAAAEVAPDGVEVQMFEGLDRLPHYNEDDDTEDPHGEVTRLRDEIAGADLVLISTPEYNGSMPGHLKNAVDWASRPFGPGSSLWGKPVAVIGASVTDYGAVWAQDHLRKSLGLAGARVLDLELAIPKAADRFGPDGELTDPGTREQLAEVMNGLVANFQPSAPVSA
ncbi:MAG TPA: NADPH-dependent FMN reductase [Solirubrobacteraceae bacterium]|nr:NADPH-dependent FMN reductase [Solirubrobacteraceae bacterium]